MSTIRVPWLTTAVLLLASAPQASAQTIYVDTSDDVTDFGGARQVADLPGPDGKISLAEAGLASDNTPGVQTIGFHIPQNDWQYQWAFPGRAVLRPFLGLRLHDTVILDGRTQTAFTGETNPDGGNEVVIWATTYFTNHTGSVASGFDNSGFSLSGGSGHVLLGNTLSNFDIYDSSFNQIGGALPGQGNTGNYIQIDRANDNVVIGNTMLRVRVLGWFGGGMPAQRNRIGGPTAGERNIIQALGTWTSEGYPSGYAIQLFDSIGTVIENNWIGMTQDGMAQGDQIASMGVWFDGRNDDTLIQDNRIAGILGHGTNHYAGWLVGTGIQLYGTGSGVTIRGNKIGLNANDEPLLGSVTGIGGTNYSLGLLQAVRIGGVGAGEGNEIAGHISSGIRLDPNYNGVTISGNSIHDNGALGIDLINSAFQGGVSQNDNLDGDSGANGLQNFPLLQSAVIQGGSLRVVGSLNSNPNSSFSVELFASPSCDASGYGEGLQFLGSAAVGTDASGDAGIDVTLAVSVPLDWSVTATATNVVSGSTSEFSACTTVSGEIGQKFCTATTNSTGAPADIAATGSASASAGNLQLGAGPVPDQNGIFFHGASQGQVPFGNGILCATGNILRGAIVTASGNAASYTYDNSDAKHDLGAFAGTTRHFQYWFRDPMGGGSLFNLSNAVSIDVQP